jgi:NNP family nitrate/nitrite transporter-like MFS transporter
MSAVAIMPDIPDRNRGAAGGATATMMMIGGFFIPSYVITPIVTNADTSVNFQLLFILAAVCFLVVTVLAIIAPDLQALVKKTGKQNAS